MGKLTGYQVGSVVRFWPPGAHRRGELAAIAAVDQGRYRLRHVEGDLVPGQFGKSDLLPMARRVTYGIVGGILAPLGMLALVILVAVIEMRPDWTQEWGAYYPLIASAAVCVAFAGLGMLRIATDPLAPRPLGRYRSTPDAT